MRTAMAPLERKGMEYLPFFGEIKEYNDRTGTIGGLANRFNNIDLVDDRTHLGAFRNTLSKAYARKAAENDPFLYPYFYNHDSSQIPPGGVYDADETKEGLYARVQFNLDLESGRGLFSSFKMKTLKRQSIGYKTVKSEYTKDAATGRTIRELLEIDLLEISAVVFPANPLAIVDTVKRYWPGFSGKGGSTMNKLAVRGKDFDSRYATETLDDWQFSDWGDLTTALKLAVMDCFSGGSDPEAALESDVIPQFTAALRQYVSDGVALGYDGTRADSYAMMSMSGGSESKAGYLNASDHAAIKESSQMIMKHAKIIASASARVENANARARAGQLAGWPVYGSMSEPSYFEQKEVEEDINLQLKLIATRLEVDNALRESHQDLAEMREMSSPAAGVERALARLIESTRR